LFVATSFGTVAARRRTDVWFEVKIQIDKGPPLDVYAYLNAVGAAFGFALGRRIILRGFEEVTAEKQSRCLIEGERGTTRQSVLSPLFKEIELAFDLEHFIGQAIEFFLTDLGKKVDHHLSLVRDVADNLFSTRQTLACIAVEGLVKLASVNADPGGPGFVPKDRDIVRKWLGEQRDVLSPRFIARLEGFLGALEHRQPAHVLKGWVTAGLLGISERHVKAWSESRNSGTHAAMMGKTPSREELQAQSDRHVLVLHLLNTIALQLMNYNGRCVDFSRPNWPIVQFSAAPRESL
jgi:hypothetical protein